MTPSEASELLTLASAYDNRKVSREGAMAWADALHGLRRVDCAQAVREHFRDSMDYLLPAHVRAGVKRIRADRLRAVPSSALEPADVDPNDIEAYQRARLALVQTIADGEPLAEPAELPHRPVAELVASTAARLPRIPAPRHQ